MGVLIDASVCQTPLTFSVTRSVAKRSYLDNKMNYILNLRSQILNVWTIYLHLGS